MSSFSDFFGRERSRLISFDGREPLLEVRSEFDNFDTDDQVHILISQINLQLIPYDQSISNIGPDLSDGIVLSILIDIHIPQFVYVVSEFPPERKISACLIVTERFLPISALGLTPESFMIYHDLSASIPFLVQFIDDSFKDLVVEVPIDALRDLLSNNPNSGTPDLFEPTSPSSCSSHTDLDSRQIKGEVSDVADEKVWRPLLIEEDIPPEFSDLPCILIETRETLPYLPEKYSLENGKEETVPVIVEEDIVGTEKVKDSNNVITFVPVDAGENYNDHKGPLVWLVFVVADHFVAELHVLRLFRFLAFQSADHLDFKSSRNCENESFLYTAICVNILFNRVS